MTYHDHEVCESNADDLEKLHQSLTDLIARYEATIARSKSTLQVCKPRSHDFTRHAQRADTYAAVVRDLKDVLNGWHSTDHHRLPSPRVS